MSYTWADFLKEVKKKYPKAKPDKIIKLIKNQYTSNSKNSSYNVNRSSWTLNVIEAIHFRIGTTGEDRKRKIATTKIIYNWVKSKDFKNIHTMLLGKPIEDKAKLVKRINDIWVAPKNRHLRNMLKKGGTILYK